MTFNLSTAGYAELIVKDYINGIRVSAVRTFRRALRAHCDPEALLLDIHEQFGENTNDFIKLVSLIFKNIDKK